jgi:hypothetical protein
MFSHNVNYRYYRITYYLNVCLLNLVAYNKFICTSVRIWLKEGSHFKSRKMLVM